MHGEQEIQQDAEEEDKGRGRQVTLRDLGTEQHLGHREAGVRLDSQGEQGPTFARGRSPSSPVCVVEGGVEWRDRSCPPPGRGVNDPGVHLSSPRGKVGGQAGSARRRGVLASARTERPLVATVGRRAGEGRGGPGGHFLPGSAQFCKGSAARAGGAGAGSGREAHARARPAEGRGGADKGRGRRGNGTKRLSHPVSPASLTPQPASSFRDTAGEAHVSHVRSSYV